jgi:hypothetical protein
LIPDILASPKEALTVEEIVGTYIQRKDGREGSARLNSGSRLALIGKRIYYNSRLHARGLVSLFRTAHDRGEGNAYLPQSRIIIFANLAMFPHRELKGIASNLGEWCTFEAL